MWIWITLFLITVGIGFIAVSQTVPLLILGLIALITGVTTMIFSVGGEAE